mmetsp:Transcript_20308/g.56420  ORF Transcript_20308/g.56420 Transcript_20308/m.56420 type:complete len:286 (+) Transcript_20308:428-1285(+)
MARTMRKAPSSGLPCPRVSPSTSLSLRRRAVSAAARRKRRKSSTYPWTSSTRSSTSSETRVFCGRSTRPSPRTSTTTRFRADPCCRRPRRSHQRLQLPKRASKAASLCRSARNLLRRQSALRRNLDSIRTSSNGCTRLQSISSSNAWTCQNGGSRRTCHTRNCWIETASGCGRIRSTIVSRSGYTTRFSFLKQGTRRRRRSLASSKFSSCYTTESSSQRTSSGSSLGNSRSGCTPMTYGSSLSLITSGKTCGSCTSESVRTCCTVWKRARCLTTCEPACVPASSS